MSPVALFSSGVTLIFFTPTVFGEAADASDEGSISISTKLSPVPKSYDHVFPDQLALTVLGTIFALSQFEVPVSLPESIPVGATLVSALVPVVSTSI